MFKIKDIIVGTYENFYKQNIQMQFLNDTKFTTFMQFLCTSGSDYQNVLKDFSTRFNLDTQKTEPSKFILNSIGALLGLPPVEYFSVNGSEALGLEYYIMLIKGQQLKNTWDGTNMGIIENLNVLFPDYDWSVKDDGTMSIEINLKQREIPIDNTVKELFEDGWFTPKPAGVGVICNTVDFEPFSWDDENCGWDDNDVKWV